MSLDCSARGRGGRETVDLVEGFVEKKMLGVDIFDRRFIMGGNWNLIGNTILTVSVPSHSQAFMF